LCGESGTDERAGAGDGGEVMSEEDPAGRGYIVMTVSVGVAGSDTAIIERQRLGGNERAVITIADGVYAKRSQQNRERVQGHSS